MEEREKRYYRTLYEVARLINSTLDTRTVSRAITKCAAEALNAKACSLMVLSPDRQDLYHTASHGLSEWYLQKGPIHVDESIAGALDDVTVTILDAATDPRIQYPAQAEREGIVSMLTVPMQLREETLGVLRIYTAEPRTFTEDEVEFARAIANLGAIALENAQRYESMKTNYDDLRRNLLEWYTMSR
jgi:GAF domain-containing protein